MNRQIRIAEVLLPETKEEICSRILSDLPEWFGIPEALERYIRDSREKYMAAVREGEEYVGFVSLHEHNRYSAEIFVMGILKRCQRRGYGKMLIEKCEEVLKERNFVFLTVKTLSSAHPDLHYTRTRRFYSSMGFLPLEEFPDLWGKENPCLMLAKVIQWPGTLP
ncbi:MAG TPA: GNAT family N-acetyltransferase [Candidatus Mcinerneyibacteriales bacterium]|jgi:ribosomal protein S18 acetylase RimI-like enzyme|nr:GNAT family N-acetyltransferase [Candidatus Mcinerneyibacteriales bacterium]HPE20478.1 GNAT family N-acetyltransferase [Candidatus Mcinerneyibacteriales bacterium]HPJ69277.1 GNAT family N-acetyltransferase [Candidatus Mcinerneyibacteriales bacterium]HPQ89194.1 GNAT family N-acetyltransferase [Candidatus Mcinerneyibacteriales bacterium]